MKVISVNRLAEKAIRYCLDEDITVAWFTGSEKGDIIILSTLLLLPEVVGFNWILGPNFDCKELKECYEYFKYGEPYLSSEVKKAEPGLTKRESQVVYLLLQDKSVKMVAYELGISFNTVQVHKTRIFKKLGVQTTVGLVLKMLK